MTVSFKISGKKTRIDSGSPSVTWSFQTRPGGWIIAEGSDGSRMRFMFHSHKDRFSASSKGVLWNGEIARDRQSGTGGSRSMTDDSDLTAQFPGKVRKILVQAGSVVEEGDPLLLVEAMKMEFAIRAPFRGKIGRICVQEGQQISPGDRFVDFEETGAQDSGGANA